MRALLAKTKKSRRYRWIAHHISSIAFVTGFLWDTITLTRIDLIYENFVFISYLVIAFVGILLVHGVETGRFKRAFLVENKAWLPAIVQFPLGGLFSGFVIFYTKSASLVTSWPFLALLFALFVGNEFFRRRYERLVFQISVFFFSLTSYLILVVPILLGTIGTATFVLATVSALFVMALVLQVVMRLFPHLYKRSVRGIWMAITGIFVGFHILYFSNMIPPVPLALKEIGIYHSVIRENGVYQVRYEKPVWYEFWRDTHSIYHRVENEAAYCFTSVFAPTDLTTKVFHVWEWRTANGAWMSTERIGFSLFGGRDGGYRGYTIKTSLKEGEWRCVVELEKGQVIGQTRFVIVDTDTAVALSENAL